MNEIQFRGPNPQEPIGRKPDVMAEAFRDHPEALKLCGQACEIAGPGCPPQEAAQPTNPRQDPPREPESRKYPG